MEISNEELFYQFTVLRSGAAFSGSGRTEREAPRPVQICNRKEKPPLDQRSGLVTSKVPCNCRPVL